MVCLYIKDFSLCFLACISITSFLSTAISEATFNMHSSTLLHLCIPSLLAPGVLARPPLLEPHLPVMAEPRTVRNFLSKNGKFETIVHRQPSFSQNEQRWNSLNQGDQTVEQRKRDDSPYQIKCNDNEQCEMVGFGVSEEPATLSERRFGEGGSRYQVSREQLERMNPKNIPVCSERQPVSSNGQSYWAWIPCENLSSRLENDSYRNTLYCQRCDSLHNCLLMECQTLVAMFYPGKDKSNTTSTTDGAQAPTQVATRSDSGVSLHGETGRKQILDRQLPQTRNDDSNDESDMISNWVLLHPLEGRRQLRDRRV